MRERPFTAGVLAGQLFLLGLPVAAQEALVGTVAAEDIVGDATNGERVFRRCQACHSVGEGAGNGVGPSLNGVVGAKAAAAEGFDYSESLREAAEAGLAWTLEDLHDFLEGPRDKVPGTIMSFPGLRDESDRNDVIAYLFEASPDGQGQLDEEE